MDELTLLTLRVIALETKSGMVEKDFANLSARIKNLEDLKLPQELQIISVDIKELKKKVLEASKATEQKAELVRKIKKINK